MNTAKNKLIDTVGRYNLTVNNISKFQFSEKETNLFCEMMNEFAEEYHKQQLALNLVVGQSEQLRFLIDKFQTPKGNYLIELLMTEKERKDKNP
tara:strand:+ start:364 stop:645 length:282 start_codon:yes stop_codon:yes gene_type:complete